MNESLGQLKIYLNADIYPKFEELYNEYNNNCILLFCFIMKFTYNPISKKWITITLIS